MTGGMTGGRGISHDGFSDSHQPSRSVTLPTITLVLLGIRFVYFSPDEVTPAIARDGPLRTDLLHRRSRPLSFLPPLPAQSTSLLPTGAARSSSLNCATLLTRTLPPLPSPLICCPPRPLSHETGAENPSLWRQDRTLHRLQRVHFPSRPRQRRGQRRTPRHWSNPLLSLSLAPLPPTPPHLIIHTIPVQRMFFFRHRRLFTPTHTYKYTPIYFFLHPSFSLPLPLAHRGQ